MRYVCAVLALLAFSLTELSAPPAAQAAGYCPGQKGGKCPQPKKKKGKSRDDFSPSQREKLMEQARKICVEKYGATSRVYQLDYKKWRVVCTTPGY